MNNTFQKLYILCFKLMLIVSAVVILLLSVGQVLRRVLIPQYDYEMFVNGHTICHALGEIDGVTLTNSLEAFENNYAKGHRVFEVDFMTTSDGVMVAGHDWITFNKQAGLGEDNDTPLALEEFRKEKVYGKYTALTLEDVLVLMLQYPDIYLVTDTKNDEYAAAKADFEQIYTTALDVDSALLDRIVPQIYNPEMLDAIRESYDWQEVIFTLYQYPYEKFNDALDFAFVNGIKYVTIPAWPDYQDWFLRRIRQRNLRVFMHTFNTMEEATDLKYRLGIWGVYTDTLTPDQVGSLYPTRRY